MAGGKDEAKDVIIDDLVQSLIHGFSESPLPEFQFPLNLSVLLLKHAAAAESVDGAPLRRCHQPRRRFFWDAIFRPLFESCNERILSEFLGNAEVTGNARNPRDESRGFDLPYGLDRLVNVAHA
jgi:hypothetical protein